MYWSTAAWYKHTIVYLIIWVFKVVLNDCGLLKWILRTYIVASRRFKEIFCVLEVIHTYVLLVTWVLMICLLYTYAQSLGASGIHTYCANPSHPCYNYLLLVHDKLIGRNDKIQADMYCSVNQNSFRCTYRVQLYLCVICVSVICVSVICVNLMVSATLSQ